jgi:HPt (histidine-containing phosphotransfer) domain-containing protein
LLTSAQVSDKLTQNEIQDLEETLQQGARNDNSILENLLDKIPDGIFGGDKKQQMHQIQGNANSAQMQQMQVSPREPEEYTLYVKQVFEQIMPAIEFHDGIMKNISAAIEKIPILPAILDQLQEQLALFVFSIMAPFVVPVIQQVKNELRTGSYEIVQSSKHDQHIVFRDDESSDPTHTMLSKDHFSNILNEIAGQTASKVVAWVVPQIMEAWDNEGTDAERTINRIINGVLHHPAQRDMGEDGARDGRQLMFRSVEEWWRHKDQREQDDFRRKLSRDGVERGENNKEGVHDCGHGSGGKLKMHKNFKGSGGGGFEDKIATAATGAIMGGMTAGLADLAEQTTGQKIGVLEQADQHYNRPQQQQQQEESSGGFGGFLSSAASNLLGGAFKSGETETYRSGGREEDGGYSQTTTQYGRDEDSGRYGQAEYKRTQYDDGGERQEYSRYEQRDDDDRRGAGGYGYQESSEYRREESGGYERRTEQRWETSESSYRTEETSSGWGGGRRQEEESSGGGFFGGGGGEGEGAGGLLGDFVRGAERAFGGEGRDDRREDRQEGW